MTEWVVCIKHCSRRRQPFMLASAFTVGAGLQAEKRHGVVQSHPSDFCMSASSILTACMYCCRTITQEDSSYHIITVVPSISSPTLYPCIVMAANPHVGKEPKVKSVCFCFPFPFFFPPPGASADPSPAPAETSPGVDGPLPFFCPACHTGVAGVESPKIFRSD